jgi:hypothetical protein
LTTAASVEKLVDKSTTPASVANGHDANSQSVSPPRLKGLKCRECSAAYELQPKHVCEFCFGPLEVEYDYDVIQGLISRDKIKNGPYNIWRYQDLLPVEGTPRVNLEAGFTPLVRAHNLGKLLGIKELYIKNDTANPTWSFKDRVVSVALSRAVEFGFDTAACASTGNLANSVAAHAAHAGMKCFVFIPADLEAGKVMNSLVYKPCGGARQLRRSQSSLQRNCRPQPELGLCQHQCAPLLQRRFQDSRLRSGRATRLARARSRGDSHRVGFDADQDSQRLQRVQEAGHHRREGGQDQRRAGDRLQPGGARF